MKFLLSKVAFALVVVGALSGCTRIEYVTKVEVIPPLPANLAIPTVELSPLEGNTGKDVSNWFMTNVPKANQCYASHGAIVNYYNALRETQIKFNEDAEKNK